MTAQPFTIERTFHAPVEKVWAAITDKEQMKEWYFNLEAFRPEVGFEFRFEGGDECNRYIHICRVLEVVPNKKLRHTWQYEGQEEETIVTFELFAEGKHTRLKLTHEGLDRIAHHGPAFAPGNFAEGWTMIIGTSLKNYLEK